MNDKKILQVDIAVSSLENEEIVKEVIALLQSKETLSVGDFVEVVGALREVAVALATKEPLEVN